MDQGRSPNWSPDGKWVVFETDRFSNEGNYGLGIMPADGSSAVTKLLGPEYNAHHPEWDREQLRIAFNKPGEGIGVFIVPEQYRPSAKVD